MLTVQHGTEATVVAHHAGNDNNTISKQSGALHSSVTKIFQKWKTFKTATPEVDNPEDSPES